MLWLYFYEYGKSVLFLCCGAGANVDAFAAKLIKKFGPDVLRETAKLHFKNKEKALALARKLK